MGVVCGCDRYYVGVVGCVASCPNLGSEKLATMGYGNGYVHLQLVHVCVYVCMYVCMYVCRIEAEEGFNLTVCCAPFPLQISSKDEFRCNPSHQSTIITGFNFTLTWYFSCSDVLPTHRLQDCSLEPGSLWRDPQEITYPSHISLTVNGERKEGSVVANLVHVYI